ncbi:MAG: N-acetylmuramoyl-L-alanine amidase [Candidatus Dormibacteria bacterium]
MIDWCPLAQRDQILGAWGAGPMQGGQPKILHHTTEGGTYGGARGTYAQTHNLPHFTFTFEGGRFAAYQHLPLSVAATALVHVGGITNTDNVIQIEWVGYAGGSQSWPDAYYLAGAHVCRWIETQTGCKPQSSVTFEGARYGDWPGRLSWPQWDAYNGHLCHVHAPENDHYDAGGGFKITLVTGAPGGPVPVPVPVPAPKEVHVSDGYILLASDGGLFAFGDAAAALANRLGNAVGKMRGTGEEAISLTLAGSGQGYWIATSIGGVFAFGDAGFYGNAANFHMNAPVVGFCPTPTERGYWLIGGDGGVFAFGDAQDAGSMGGKALNAPVIGAVALP